MTYDAAQREGHRLAFLASILDSQPGAVCVVDKEGCFTYINAAACQRLGYPDPEELLGERLESVVYAYRDDPCALALTEQLIQVARTGSSQNFESVTWLRTRNGDPLAVIVEAAVLREGEKTAGTVVTFRECKKQQECVDEDIHSVQQDSKTKFQQQLIALLDQTPDIIALHDISGQLIYVNAAGREKLGVPDIPRASDGQLCQCGTAIPVEPSIGAFIYFCHPAWAAELLLNEGLPTARRDGFWQGETAIWNAAGEEVATSQVIIGHRNDSGEVVQFSTIIRDISDLKRAQQEVAESEQRFRLIANTISDAFWLRKDNQILYVNPAYERIWGQSAELFRADADSFLEDVHPEDRERGHLAR
ncbi:diguanylate cyclase/phosphodiesterase domain 2 [Halorhodospira halochloris]|uniref:Diguanylate cyclase/phosphodiesterase domain 2 n=1 Tax=Halorhodospira halochloris TaxID=1052 RepID=A0A0X8XCW5_HALHR|nr:PAS domain-containing protein [Halorhodospira halochloris]MBK1652937.1 hypothetical protein [Halorhodospira halochloris]BAU58659.1 diguanylate cyclase/phosphodiesterase domain 2 [Halorhodospira halochloris]